MLFSYLEGFLSFELNVNDNTNDFFVVFPLDIEAWKTEEIRLDIHIRVVLQHTISENFLIVSGSE